MRSAAMEPLASVSIATIPSRPLLGSIGGNAHDRNVRARDARRIHGLSVSGRLGNVMIPSTLAAMADSNASSSPSPRLGHVSKLDFNVFQEESRPPPHESPLALSSQNEVVPCNVFTEIRSVFLRR